MKILSMPAGSQYNALYELEAYQGNAQYHCTLKKTVNGSEVVNTTLNSGGWNSDRFQDGTIKIHSHDTNYYNHTYGYVVLAMRTVDINGNTYSAGDTIVDLSCVGNPGTGSQASLSVAN